MRGLRYDTEVSDGYAKRYSLSGPYYLLGSISTLLGIVWLVLDTEHSTLMGVLFLVAGVAGFFRGWRYRRSEAGRNESLPR